MCLVGTLHRDGKNMKEYCKWAGCFYCVTRKGKGFNSPIKHVVAVETIDELRISFITDFSEDYIRQCKPSNQFDFNRAMNKTMKKIEKGL